MKKVKKALRKYLLEQVETGKISPFCAIYLEKIAFKSIELETSSFSNGK
jgi:hypothetical protein